MNCTTSPDRRCFGIIPAAGESRRMPGLNKLVLPWHDETVMDRVLRAWTESSATRVVVIVRKGNIALQEVCRRWTNIELVIPEHDPEDMKRSIQFGLQHIASEFRPNDSDRWMVAPADLPTLDSPLINQLIDAGRDSDLIVAPRFGDRSGHPVSFPWSMSPELLMLADDEGINRLVETHPVRWIDLPAGDHPDDMDTPADYSRLSKPS